MVNENRTYIDGTHYTVEGDNRVHTDIQRVEELRKSIPTLENDACPECGNKEGLSQCRCYLDHRKCPNCGFIWRWDVDKRRGTIQLIV